MDILVYDKLGKRITSYVSDVLPRKGECVIIDSFIREVMDVVHVCEFNESIMVFVGEKL